MKKISLCLVLILTLVVPNIVFATTNNATEAVAKIGNKEYTSLAEAVAAVPTDGTETTITLLKNVEGGAGFRAVSGQNFIIDFAGYTYDAGLPTVGSIGTETNGCQFLKGSTVTFKNGTFTSKNEETSKKIIQNYGNLTLKDMTIDGTAPKINNAVSLNCGKVEILGNTSIKVNKGVKAFDACWAPTTSYTNGVQVTVNTTGKITGDIELGLWNEDDSTENSKTTLTIKNMQHEGNIVGNSELLKNVTILGGTFSTDVSAYVEKGLVCKKISNSSYKVGKEHSITSKSNEGGKVTIREATIGINSEEEQLKDKGICGENVEVIAMPEYGYYVKSITGADGLHDVAEYAYQFTMPDSDVVLNVVFAKYAYTIEADVPNEVANQKEVDEMLKETLENNKELAEAIQGKDVEIKVEVKSIEASKTEKEKMESEVNKQDSDLKITNYIEITITVKDAEEGKTLGNLETVEKTITFTVSVPENLPQVPEGFERVYYIVRNHNGKIELLQATLVNGKLQFESDKFSTYAIAYKDVEKKSEQENNNTTVNSNLKSNGENPQTGDSIIIYAILAVVSIVGLYVAMRLKNNYNKNK